jgi:hypothetical protein
VSPDPRTSSVPFPELSGTKTASRGAGTGKAGGRRRRSALLGTAAILVAAAAGGGYYYLHHKTTLAAPSSLRLPSTEPTGPIPGFSAALGKYQHITTRKQDKVPLSVAQLYPPRFVLTGTSVSYVRAATNSVTDCSLAVFGTQLATALASGKCSQVVRASYVSGDGQMMGTIGVINLVTADAAQQAGQVSGPEQLIAPLTTAKGPTKNLLNGTGMVYAEVKGHYLILMYVEYTNLKAPSTTAQKQALLDFAMGMFGGSANPSLSARMLNGHP